MALKFLNKKGWHTGSLRNIENVWKAEQKHDAEQKKLEELRKQIQEERERSEFRLLQEQAGLVPRQERLEFLYESGLAVGKGSNANFDGFKDALEPSSSSSSLPQPPPSTAATQQQQQQPSVPGALFEEKPQSANDTWRKLHSDPLLLIRQREQQSLARVKNNPVQMAIIRNSVEANMSKEKSQSKDLKEKKRHKKKQKHHEYSSSVGEEERTDVRVGKRSSKGDELSVKMDYSSGREQRKKHPKDLSPSVEEEEEERSKHSRGVGKSSKDERSHKIAYVSEIEERDAKRNRRHHHRDPSSVEEEERLKYTRGAVRSSRSDKLPDKIDYEREDRKRNSEKNMYRKQPASASSLSTKDGETWDEFKRNLDKPKYDEKDKKLESRKMMDYESDKKRRREVEEEHSHYQASSANHGSSSKVGSIRSEHHRRPHHHVPPSKLSAEERAAKLREMQMDAELHEENRWKRIKKADEIDTMQEAAAAATMTGNNTASGSSRNFLDAAKRSVYGAEKGGSATIEESVRRRTHYLQSRSEVGQGNAFRR